MGNDNSLSGGYGGSMASVNDASISSDEERLKRDVLGHNHPKKKFEDEEEDVFEDDESDDDILSLAKKREEIPLKRNMKPKRIRVEEKVKKNVKKKSLEKKRRDDELRYVDQDEYDDEDSLPSNSSSSEEEENGDKYSNSPKSKSLIFRNITENMKKSKIRNLEEVETKISELNNHYKLACRRIREFEKTKKATYELVTNVNDSIEQASGLIKNLEAFFFENRTRNISSQRIYQKLQSSFEKRRDYITQHLNSGENREIINAINRAKIVKPKKKKNNLDKYQRMKNRREKHLGIEENENEGEENDDDEYDGRGIKRNIQRQRYALKKKFVVTEEVADTVKVEEEIAKEYNRELKGLNMEMNMVQDMMQDMSHLVNMQGNMIDDIEDNVDGAVRSVKQGRKHIKRAGNMQMRKMGGNIIKDGVKGVLGTIIN